MTVTTMKQSNNKSSPKPYGKIASLPQTAENALVYWVCQLCNVHCR